MAAATQNTTLITQYLGSMRVHIVDVTWTNGDTLDTLLSSICHVSFTPTTNTAFGITKSSGTLTLVSGGSLTGTIMAFSNPE